MSKLPSTTNREAERVLNQEIFDEAHLRCFLSLAEEGVVDRNEEEWQKFSSSIRVAELINSCTEDIIRYCEYHHIKQDASGLFILSGATRAAFFIKWVMNFRPINVDNNLITDTEEILGSLEAFSQEFFDSEDITSTYSIWGTSPQVTSAFLCNEIFCLYLIDVAMMLTKKNGEQNSIMAIIRGRELRSFLYALRFRIKHQDSFMPFLNRVLYSDGSMVVAS